MRRYILSPGVQVFSAIVPVNGLWAETGSTIFLQNSGALAFVLLFFLVCLLFSLIPLIAFRKKITLETEKKIQAEKELYDISGILKKTQSELTAVKDRLKESEKYRIDNQREYRGLLERIEQDQIGQADKEKKQLEDQIQRAQQVESIGILASGIAHDFNNLLMGIQGNASIMLFQMEKGHPFYEKLTNIETCIQSGAALTKQLLGFAGGRKYGVAPLDMAELVKEIAATFGRTKKEISINEKYHGDIWAVEGERGQIEQVVLNLFINSWHAMTKGKDLFVEVSNIRIDYRNERPSEVAPGNYVKILISNTEEIFRDNQHESLTFSLPKDFKTGVNSGLSLASSFGVIRGYDGAVGYRFLKDGGTAYIVCLPAAAESAVKNHNFEAVEIKGSGIVLFVDDEEMIVEVAKPMLEELGYDVLVARDGYEAVKVYKDNKERVDLVILDMVMPKIGGAEVFEELKRINPDVKTLLASGYGIDDRTAAILDSGPVGFIHKPFNLKSLSMHIQDVMKK